jgi:predicted dienelactone hydrolase
MTPLKKHLCSTLVTLSLALGASLMSAQPSQAQVAMRQIKGLGGEITLIYPTAQINTVQRMGPFEIEVAFAAKPGLLNGRLIVMSHGSGGSALSDHTLARTLALAGFVVAQPIHQGDNWQDSSGLGPVTWKRRPLEISQAIDAVAADAMFASLINFNKTGVHGMSAGGVSALTLAGAQWSTKQLIQHCTNQFQADRNFCMFGARSEKEMQERMASFKAATISNTTTATNSSTNSSNRDPVTIGYQDLRVVAVSAMVPVAAIFDPASFSSISRPLAITSATADELLVPQFHSDYVLKHCPSCIALTRLEGAGHFDTLSPWPESIAKPVAEHMPGGKLGKRFDSTQRQVAFDKIAQFFVQNFLKP